ncbi:hypothetical protein [Phaeodactylibacter xiamenensis]|uniref:hypothetical protein n=1 Tax=Phaeodactylibacter xiamenensis TaxID=1524460 RepID=UPI003BA97DDC
MNYEIKIDNAVEAKGAIDLGRLAKIAEGIRRISEGALQIRLRGISLTKGRKKVSLQNALKVTLTDIKEGSTVLCLSTEPFEKTLEPYQTDIFRAEAQAELPAETPMSLFIKSFQYALTDEDPQELLDKPLLRELKSLKKAFLSEGETMRFSNQGSLPVLELTQKDFTKIKVLEDEIPDPQPVVLNGIVELLQYSKLKVKIKTAEGIVDGFLSDDLSSEDIAPFWGKEITITGTSHFKPRGRSVIEIERVFEPGAGDDFFSKRPKSETVDMQIARQIREKGSNPLADIVGKWPGEETDEEFEELLKTLD